MFRTNKLMPIVSTLDFSALDELVNGVLPVANSTTSMKVDIFESDNSFTLKADLPGYNKDNIEVDFKEGNLSITAKRESVKESVDSNNVVLRSERFFGEVRRTFNFGDAVDNTSIVANYNDGVLAVSLPKKAKLDDTTRVAIS